MYKLTYANSTYFMPLRKFDTFTEAAEEVAFLVKYEKTHIESIHSPLVGAWDYYTPIGVFEIAPCDPDEPLGDLEVIQTETP